ncbi:hypothetical protein Rhopal_006287-T1 [Rhodotorula paludigena]|uniref:DUF803-domain-containing protein n=1 Tax=Rhodotorula paludigena TaxID=86838 RepID=A0AAV5GUR1_9BASI|nr:hypothetical protein Rhopal_006287-T1 [Rhodotorula paludigena]
MDAAAQAAAAAAEQVSSFDANDKYIGLGLAISSSFLIGTSFIITKKGLISAADQHDGFSSDSHSYLKNGLWWAGMLTMVVGEVANFAAYTFAPPILVTPLGALSVLIGAVLAAFFLGERLGKIGVSGCALCLVGSLIIVLHAPEEKEINSVDEILEYALQPGFMFYCFFVLTFSLYMIYRVAPKHGTSNPLVYVSICSLVGSVSVMAVKGFGVALKLTFGGNNQLWRAGTWIFAFTVAGCIAVQMNYFNKALDIFPTTNLSRSENEAMAARRYSSAGQRQSLLQESRLSFVSDGGNGERVGPDARRSATLYRAGGITMGGVEPLFDYEEVGQTEPHGHGGAQKKSEGGANGGRRGETAIQMEQFSLQNDDDDDDSDSDREVQASQYNHHQQQRRTIAGKKILNEYLALGTFGITGLSAWAATRGGSNDKKVDAKVEPKATATSDEEAAFLENFINDRVEHKEKAAAKH